MLTAKPFAKILIINKIIIEDRPYVSATEFINGLSIVENNNGEFSIINKNDNGQIPFRKQRIIQTSNGKYEIKYGFLQTVIYKTKSYGEIKCLSGNCNKYFPHTN